MLQDTGQDQPLPQQPLLQQQPLPQQQPLLQQPLLPQQLQLQQLSQTTEQLQMMVLHQHHPNEPTQQLYQQISKKIKIVQLQSNPRTQCNVI